LIELSFGTLGVDVFSIFAPDVRLLRPGDVRRAAGSDKGLIEYERR
jgi:hypothetical protein